MTAVEMACLIHAVKGCTICLPPAGNGPIVRVFKAGREYRAVTAGTCDTCREPIRPGDAIQRWDDDGYRHAGRCLP